VRGARLRDPVKAEFSKRAFQGVIHVQASSGHTFFVEPFEPRGSNNELVRLLDGAVGDPSHPVAMNARAGRDASTLHPGASILADVESPRRPRSFANILIAFVPVVAR